MKFSKETWVEMRGMAHTEVIIKSRSGLRVLDLRTGGLHLLIFLVINIYIR